MFLSVPRVAPRRWAALAALAVLLVGLVTAGSAYAWCPHMQRAMTVGCCHGPGDGAEAKKVEGPVAAEPCCEQRHVDALPTAVSVADVDAALPMAPSAWSPAWVMANRPARIARISRFERPPIRAGPIASARRRRARLAVYRC